MEKMIVEVESSYGEESDGGNHGGFQPGKELKDGTDSLCFIVCCEV
jgi:hypothetical protein